MDPLRLLIAMMLERVIKDVEMEESSGASAAVGYTTPLGAGKPTIVDPEKPTGRSKTRRRTRSAFGDAKPTK